MNSRLGPIGKQIFEKLQTSLAPLHLIVECESHMHNVPKGSEKHFYVLVASEKFEGLTVLQRHRLVNECLAAELAGPIHALRIDAIPSSKWAGQQPSVAPRCQGGGKF